MTTECWCDFEPAAFYCRTELKAVKEHTCTECGSAIQPGEKYERVAGKWDGSFSSFKTCPRCVALRDHIKAHVPCFCWAHGSLLDDARMEVENLPVAAYGSGLLFELGRMAVAIKRAPKPKARHDHH